MTETLKSVIAVKDGRAYYELEAGRIDCYVGFKHAGTPFDALVSVKPYTQERMLRLLKADEGYRKPAKDEPGAVDVDATDPDLMRDFVDEHLIEMRIEGRILNPKQIETIDAQHGVKAAAYTMAYNGLLIDMGERGDIPLDDLLSDKVTISLWTRLVDESGAQHRIDIEHHFASPTAKDSVNFSRSSKVRTTRDGNVRLPVNWEARVKLYDTLIQSVDGVLVGGELCVPETKAEWVGRLPLLYKTAALHQLFRGASTKND